ncbi:DnaD domain protein [Alicyclobacillus fastidiosus]|uniref:DnaD domain protein n=1 Tax=Alicyclobacillus fastidiosus TaxID=392011 RepID=A0ABV5ALE3_9BACL
MNYIREINAFYDWLETHELSPSCICLWHALMAVNNKAGWVSEFTVAISTLEAKTGLKKKTIERSRKALEESGLIVWRSRSGNQAAVYSMQSLCVKNDPQNVLRVKNDAQSVSHNVPQSVAINKLNETKQDLSDDGERARVAKLVQGFEQAFGRLPNQLQIDDLVEYTDNGMELELVLRTIRSSGVGNTGVKYMFSTLRNQYDRGIRTVAQADLDDELHKNAGGSRNGQNRGHRHQVSITRSGTKSVTNGKVGRF